MIQTSRKLDFLLQIYLRKTFDRISIFFSLQPTTWLDRITRIKCSTYSTPSALLSYIFSFIFVCSDVYGKI